VPSDGTCDALVMTLTPLAVVVPPLLLPLPPLLLPLLVGVSLPASWVSLEPPQADSNTRPSKAIEHNLRISFIPWVPLAVIAMSSDRIVHAGWPA